MLLDEQKKPEYWARKNGDICDMGNGHFSVWERCCMHSIFFSCFFADNGKLFVRCSILNCVLKHETHLTKKFVFVNRSRWSPLPFVHYIVEKCVFIFLLLIIFNGLKSKGDQTVWHFSLFLKSMEHPASCSSNTDCNTVYYTILQSCNSNYSIFHAIHKFLYNLQDGKSLQLKIETKNQFRSLNRN